MTTPEQKARAAADERARTDNLRKKCFALAKELGLTDEMRHALSGVVFGVPEDRPRWRDMNYEQLGRLADHLLGYHYITTLKEQYPPNHHTIPNEGDQPT